MSLIAFGTNFNYLKLEQREKVMRCFLQKIHDIQYIVKNLRIEEIVTINTCNRAEIYYNSPNENNILWQLFKEDKDILALKDKFYIHKDILAVNHIMRVTSGLDSAVTGETQIFKQMKIAYQVAHQQGLVRKKFNRLFNDTFNTAKTIHKKLTLNRKIRSIPHLAVNVAKNRKIILNSNILIIGAGMAAEELLEYLHKLNYSKIIIANRTQENAQLLADKYGLNKVIKIDNIVDILPEIDIIFSVANVNKPLLDAKILLKQQKHKNKHLTIFDLSFPRNIDYCNLQNQNKSITYFDLDSLSILSKKSNHTYKQKLSTAEDIIQCRIHKYWQWQKSLDKLVTLCKYRQQAEKLKTDIINKAKRKLGNGMSAEQVLTEAMNNLANKLLHHPTVKMHQAALNGDQDVLNLVEFLFNNIEE